MNKTRGIPDFFLFVLTVVLVGFGIVMVFSSSSIIAYTSARYGNDSLYFVKRQLMWAGIGFVFMLIASNIPLKFYKRNFAKIAMLSMFLLILVYVPGVGKEINNAKGWIGVGPLTLQPLEFVKLGLTIYLSGLIAKKGELIRDLKHGLIPLMVVISVFCFAIAAQPDVGGAAIVGMVAVTILFAAGVQLKHLFNITFPLLIVGIIYTVSESYRLSRLSTLLNPWNDPLKEGYQVIQGFYAIAHGSFTGVGFGQSIQKYLYLPYPHTDFIFPILIEELGFIGGAILILAFFVLIWRILFITQRSNDIFAKLMGVGVSGMISIQLFVNIGGTIGIIPMTGVTLPFISYGGSSLLSLLISMGIILSISRDIDKMRRKNEPAKTHLKVI